MVAGFMNAVVGIAIVRRATATATAFPMLLIAIATAMASAIAWIVSLTIHVGNNDTTQQGQIRHLHISRPCLAL